MALAHAERKSLRNKEKHAARQLAFRDPERVFSLAPDVLQRFQFKAFGAWAKSNCETSPLITAPLPLIEFSIQRWVESLARRCVRQHRRRSTQSGPVLWRKGREDRNHVISACRDAVGWWSREVKEGKEFSVWKVVMTQNWAAADLFLNYAAEKTENIAVVFPSAQKVKKNLQQPESTAPPDQYTAGSSMAASW